MRPQELFRCLVHRPLLSDGADGGSDHGQIRPRQIVARYGFPRSSDTGGEDQRARREPLERRPARRAPPGDAVVIETSGDFRRPKLTTGLVVRMEGPHLVVSTRSPRGVRYVTHFGRRHGVSVGGGHRYELVNGEAASPKVSADPRQQTRIDATYRSWARNHGDVEKLRELQAAIS
jgi:hypothetical protein